MSYFEKFINKPQDLIKNTLTTIVSTNTNLQVIPGTQAVVLKQVPQQVSLLCGGGSGHEPAHAGFAAVCGNVFSSPPYQYVYEAIKYLNEQNNNKGVLVLIKNYTGDIINFNLAIQLAQSQNIQARSLVIADDIAFIQNYEEIQQDERRGLAGTVLLYKILGAAASEISDLNQLFDLGEKVNKNFYTIGVSLSPCSIPGQKPHFILEEGMMEIGLGIHGEKGLNRMKLQSSQEIVNQVLKMFDNFVKQNEKIIVLINNLGSTTDLEISQLTYDFLSQAQQWNIKTLITGKAMSSLEMHGISFTILTLQGLDEQKIVQWISKDVDCSSWNGFSVTQNPKIQKVNFEPSLPKISGAVLSQDQVEKLKILFIELKKEENYLNKLDGEVGDGDLGQAVNNGCDGVLNFMQNKSINLGQIGHVLAQSMGGSSGPLFASFFFGLNEQIKDFDQVNWGTAVMNGINKMKELGGAQFGDRTMLDVLIPLGEFYLQSDQIFNNQKQNLIDISNKKGEEASQMRAKKGRSRYLGGKEIGKKEPGCELIIKILQLMVHIF